MWQNREGCSLAMRPATLGFARHQQAESVFDVRLSGPLGSHGSRRRGSGSDSYPEASAWEER